MESDGDSLLVRSHDTILRESQDYFRPFTTSEVSQADALLADRLAEADREAVGAVATLA